MFKVLLRAPLLTNSGYGVHSRQIFSWLFARNDVDLTVECLQWGHTPWILSSEKGGKIIDNIISCSKEIKKGEYDYSFQVQLPDEWDNGLAKFNIGVTAAVETDKCNPAWIDAINKMDKVIVPSKFTKNVIKRSGYLTTDVTVIPEWYNIDIGNKSENSKILNDDRFSKIDSLFNFLVIGTLTSQQPEDDRKNLVNTIKMLCEEFDGDENVGVVIKTNMGKGTTIDKTACTSYLKKVLSKYRKNTYPKFYFVHGNLSSKEISALYAHNKVKAYVSATRGEGYGLPLIESAAAGLPIVATGWSGHLEFLSKENFYDVDYNLVEVSKNRVENRIFVEGVKWAEPIPTSFKRNCRKVYENYEEAKQGAKKQRKHVLHNFNKTVVCSLYDKFFESVI